MIRRQSLLAVILVVSLGPTARCQSDDANGWWQDLRGPDAKPAYQAMWKFVDRPEQALTFLQKRLQPVQPVEDKIVERLIQDLNDDSFTVRTDARSALEKLAELAEPELRKALERKPSVETTQTLNRLLKNLAGPAANAEQLAQCRALEILEHISLSAKKVPSDQARKILHDLAQGVPQARLTMQAKNTLDQVQRRTSPTGKVVAAVPPRTRDLFGDPLPKGASARLGTTRFRHYLAAFTPDGKSLSGVSPAGVFLTDLSTGRETRAFTGKGLENCLDVVISPNGRYLAVNYPREEMGQPEHAVDVWDLVDNKHLHHFAVSEEGARAALLSMSIMAFSADSMLLFAGTKASLHAWDMATGREKTFFSHALPSERSPGVVVVSPRGKYLLTGSGGERLVHLWDLAGRKKMHSLENPARDIGMVSAAFSHDEKIAAIGNSDGQVKLYATAAGDLLRTLSTSAKAVSLAFAPDGQTLAVACNDRFSAPAGAEIYLWNLADRTQGPRRFPAADVRWVRFSPDGKTLALGAWDTAVTLIDVASGKDLYPREAHVGPILALAWSNNGLQIATGSEDHTARLWDAHSGQSLRVFRGHTSRVNSVALSPDGRALATGSSDGSVILWDTADGTKKYQLRSHHTVHAVLFTPDGKSVLAMGVHRNFRVREASLRIFDPATGKERTAFDRGEPGWLPALSPDGRVLATAGQTTVRLREFPSGKLLHAFEVENRVDCLAFSPDGRTLAIDSVGESGRIQLLETLTREERGSLPGYLDPSCLNTRTHVAFSPDGRYLASCGAVDAGGMSRKDVRVWNLATGTEAASFAGHRSYVNCLSFSPDGRHLATGGVDASVLIWIMASRAP